MEQLKLEKGEELRFGCAELGKSVLKAGFMVWEWGSSSSQKGSGLGWMLSHLDVCSEI